MSWEPVLFKLEHVNHRVTRTAKRPMREVNKGTRDALQEQSSIIENNLADEYCTEKGTDSAYGASLV